MTDRKLPLALRKAQSLSLVSSHEHKELIKNIKVLAIEEPLRSFKRP
jgi:hypothetical protein